MYSQSIRNGPTHPRKTTQKIPKPHTFSDFDRLKVTSCHIPQPITTPRALPSGEADTAVPSYSFPQLLAPAASHPSK